MATKSRIGPWNPVRRIHLDAGGAPDVFLKLDVTAIFGQSYILCRQLAHRLAAHCITHVVGPARTVQNCHIPGLVRDLSRVLGEPLLEEADAARKQVQERGACAHERHAATEVRRQDQCRHGDPL